MLGALRPINGHRGETNNKIEETLHFSVLRPGGNDTGLIVGVITDPEQKRKIASILQKIYSSIEQVGFISTDQENAELMMAGGEFCGNAARSAAYEILHGETGTLSIKVSGVKKKLLAGVTEDGEAFSQIPIYADPDYVSTDPEHPNNALVVMEGIIHYIDFNFGKIRGLTADEIKEKARAEMAKRGMDKEACCGIIYVDQREDWLAIHPIVYIRDVDTLFYETACGSGTTALGQVLALRKGQSIRDLPILQPSGHKIKVSVEFDGEFFGYAQIQSPIEKVREGVLDIAENQTDTQPTIDYMLKSIMQKRPKLKKLLTDKPIINYFEPAIYWDQKAILFPQALKLSNLIASHIEKLYGRETAEVAKNQFKKSWVVETGAHLHIPRRYNNLAQTDGAQINSLLFQGQVLWALTNQTFGNNLAIGLNSGRVPLDNTNSGAYLDLPSLKTPMTLASKKHHPDSPQTLIPARSQEEIEQKLELLTMYHKQRMIKDNEYELGKEILENFLAVQSGFCDQVATTHAKMMNKVLPIKQVTLDSEPIGRDFILELLKDQSSLTYSIFADPYKKAKFNEYLANIRTGWTNNNSPFYEVIQKGEGSRLIDYSGDLHPETIIKGLENKTLWPTGVMKFFVMMVEGGLLSVGGWTQTSYCTDIKLQSAKFLTEIGYIDQAEALLKMPTDIAAVAPCWGIDKVNGKFQLLDAITTILNPSTVNLSYITELTGMQTLLIAAPTLYEFLLREAPTVNYDNLTALSDFAVIRS